MTIPYEVLFVWVVIGGLAGATAGMLVKRSRRGFGLVANIGIGMVGALIGGILFDVLNVTFAESISFSLNDLIAAIVGSLILVIIIPLIQRIID